MSIEEKQQAILELQAVDTQLYEIIKLRGELPEEVADLQDELSALQKELKDLQAASKFFEEDIVAQKAKIKDTERLISKYKDQQVEVRNNREYDAITKEIELQELEAQLLERNIEKHYNGIAEKKIEIKEAKVAIDKKRQVLLQKEGELKAVMEGNREQEKALYQKRAEVEQMIDKELLATYERIKKGARNKRAVVFLERGACSGCFSVIPPQRQLDIQEQKEIVYCEYCGRIMVHVHEEEPEAIAQSA